MHYTLVRKVCYTQYFNKFIQYLFIGTITDLESSIGLLLSHLDEPNPSST